MRYFVPLLALLAVTFSPNAVVAEKAAKTESLPAALAKLNVGSEHLLTENEARQVRGQALDASGIFAAGQAIEQQASDLNGNSVLDAALDVKQRAEVTEFPGGVFFFADSFFGDGLLINLTSGRGAIFDPDNPSAGTIILADLRGSFTVQRDAQGFVLFNAN